MSYLVEQPPHCDLLRLSLPTGRFVRFGRTHLPRSRNPGSALSQRRSRFEQRLSRRLSRLRCRGPPCLPPVPSACVPSVSKALAFSVLATLEDESFFISPKFHFQPVASALGQILNTRKFPAQPSPFSFPDTPRSSLAYLPALTLGLNLLGTLVPRTLT